jgi:hypothetical protein
MLLKSPCARFPSVMLRSHSLYPNRDVASVSANVLECDGKRDLKKRIPILAPADFAGHVRRIDRASFRVSRLASGDDTVIVVPEP